MVWRFIAVNQLITQTFADLFGDSKPQAAAFGCGCFMKAGKDIFGIQGYLLAGVFDS